MVSVQDERGADEQGDEQDPVVRAVAREDRAQGSSRTGASVFFVDCDVGWRTGDGGPRLGGEGIFGRSTGDRLAGSVRTEGSTPCPRARLGVRRDTGDVIVENQQLEQSSAESQRRRQLSPSLETVTTISGHARPGGTKEKLRSCIRRLSQGHTWNRRGGGPAWLTWGRYHLEEDVEALQKPLERGKPVRLHSLH